ncbi:aminodeoxychorismate/anthranilate synthase component II [Psychrobacter arenosus]|uniref:anthranilate synthase component II n=1 Tax=Psychrobacter arenosus TaxID=256326 RepID=UPI001D115786|nr:aminodeoxychorismate/anthranilate synthase component II [Psychrobacter arenosus]
MTESTQVLMIDNHDSFTYNIVQYLEALQQDVVVWQNDAFALADIAALAPKAIIIGPGPCRPSDAGLSLAVIEIYKGQIPILGICLGHQAIGQAFGAQIVHAREIMHGRLSQVYHRQQGVFAELPSPFNVTRYHSLVIEAASLPDCLEITAWTQADTLINEIMAIRHRHLPIEGVQFHPESILSEAGYQLLNNFLQTHGLAVLDNDALPSVG